MKYWNIALLSALMGLMGVLPTAQAEELQLYFVHSDHLNTAQALTDNNQQAVWSVEQTPFGETTVNEDPDADGVVLNYNLRFPGQYFDQETGLNYNYYRDYDPSLGRYVQSDPIGLEGGVNTYGYAYQNPIRFTDFYGLKVDWNCTQATFTASVVGSIGKVIFRCESECINKKKMKIVVEAGVGGIGLGPTKLGVEMTESRGNTITDTLSNSPNPRAFEGGFTQYSGTYSIGIGYNVSETHFSGFNDTYGASGTNHGVVGGIGVGVGNLTGTATVVEQVEVDCDSDCK